MREGSAIGGRAALAIACVFAITIALSPFLPCIDLPQHIALGAVLRRLWAGEPAVVAAYVQNAATHNGGLHWAIAGLGVLGIAPELAARLAIATYPPLLIGGVALSLRRAELPPWRALLVVPTLFGLSFGWGLVNFCIGGGLAWIAIALVIAQLRAPTPRRAGLLAALALVLGLTHVMAMLLCALVAAAIGIEWFVRTGRPTVMRAARIAIAGTPLLCGCLYDVWVTRTHLVSDGSAYTTPESEMPSSSMLRRLASFINACSGLYTSYVDTALASAALVLVAALFFVAWRSARSQQHSSGSSAATSLMPSSFVSPAALLVIGYLATPDVFLNTHLIGRRLTQWVVITLILAAPRAADAAERRLRASAFAIALLAAIAAPVHFYAYNRELRGLDAALRAFPPEAMGVGVIEDPRAPSIRLPTLTHVAALQVARGGLDDGFGFARWMSFPVAYEADRPSVPYPSPSWEHDGRLYDPSTALARRYPWVLLREARENEGESDASLLDRIFGQAASHARLVARYGRWAVIDTTLMTTEPPGAH